MCVCSSNIYKVVSKPVLFLVSGRLTYIDTCPKMLMGP